MSQTFTQVQEELRRLVERTKPWSFERWSARATGREGSRADATYELVLALAAALPTTPDGVTPHRLRDVALPDQLAVLGIELSRCALDDGELERLLTEIRTTRDAIEAPPLSS